MTADQIHVIVIMLTYFAILSAIFATCATALHLYDVRQTKKMLRTDKEGWYHPEPDSIFNPYPYK